MSIDRTLYVGKIIRHRGERKVVRQVYQNPLHQTVIEFVDRSISINYEGIEFDGRK